jgi:DNA polymerase I-like protein with 3'-5' exonuclease and polymerase domains
MPYVVLDCETTTHNKGHRFDPRNKLVSYAAKYSDAPTCRFFYYTDPDFEAKLPDTTRTVVGFNFKFDCHWLFPDGLVNPVWDCQLAEHIYTGQKAQFISLNECLERYGLETKKDIVKELWDNGVQTDEIAVPILQEYNEWDVLQTEKLFLVQQELLSNEQKNLVYLLGEDLKVLASIERSGLLFDRDGAANEVVKLAAEVADVESKLQRLLPPIQFGTFNFDSGDHLSCFLYGGTLEFDYATSEESVYKSGAKKGQAYTKNTWHVEVVTFPGYFTPLENSEVSKTKGKAEATTRFYKTDVPTLSSLKGGGKVGKEIVALLQARGEKQKLVEMLESLFKQFQTKQWEGNLVHGQYNQNVAVTGRLSSSSPNMQNIPPEIDKYFTSRYD